jgi:hypothetical protein
MTTSSADMRRRVPRRAFVVPAAVLAAAVVAGGGALLLASSGSGQEVPREMVGTWAPFSEVGPAIELVIGPGGVDEGTAEFRFSRGSDCVWELRLTGVDDDLARFGPPENTAGTECGEPEFAGLEAAPSDAPGRPDALIVYYLDADGQYDSSFGGGALYTAVD